MTKAICKCGNMAKSHLVRVRQVVVRVTASSCACHCICGSRSKSFDELCYEESEDDATADVKEGVEAFVDGKRDFL